MTKQELDARLKKDAAENKFTIEADNLVFDKNSNLNYQVLESFKLKELLTKNGMISRTVLNKNLLVALNQIRENVGREVTVRASYASPEYNMLSFGAHDSDLYTQGKAVSLGIDAAHVDNLFNAAKEIFTGEVFAYPWGVHIGLSGSSKIVDKRTETGIKPQINNILTNHTMKNWMLIGAAAVAGWFFFIKK